MNLRKLNRITHRDLGYFFTGMILIYSISGIALNHLHQWNPNYSISQQTFTLELPTDTAHINTPLLNQEIGAFTTEKVLSYYYPGKNRLKAFTKNGTITISLENGTATEEIIKQRPFFSQVNFLHYNTARKWWTIFSDIFAVSLIIITVTGLFILRGKNGITRRGAVLTVAGLILPLLALLLFFK